MSTPEKTPEQITEECEADLIEIAHWFGGFDELRKVIDRVEERHNDTLADRFYSEPDYDTPSMQERMEMAYKQKYRQA